GGGRGNGRGGRREIGIVDGHRDGGRRRDVSGGVIGAGGETVGAIAHAGGRPREGEGGRGQGGEELAVLEVIHTSDADVVGAGADEAAPGAARGEVVAVDEPEMGDPIRVIQVFRLDSCVVVDHQVG